MNDTKVPTTGEFILILSIYRYLSKNQHILLQNYYVTRGLVASIPMPLELPLLAMELTPKKAFGDAPTLF